MRLIYYLVLAVFDYLILLEKLLSFFNGKWEKGLDWRPCNFGTILLITIVIIMNIYNNNIVMDGKYISNIFDFCNFIIITKNYTYLYSFYVFIE